MFRTSTTFLPHSRIASRKARSLSVKGRSVEVTNSTRSARGRKSRVRASCSRRTAFVPGVSTITRSRKTSAGAVQRSPPDGHLALHLLAVAEQPDPGGGGRDPFLQHALAEERVDERALARIELADHHQQERLVELGHRCGERAPRLFGGSQAGEPVAQLAEEHALIALESSPRLVEGEGDHVLVRAV